MEKKDKENDFPKYILYAPKIKFKKPTRKPTPLIYQNHTILWSILNQRLMAMSLLKIMIIMMNLQMVQNQIKL